MEKFELSEDQDKALELIAEWYDGKPMGNPFILAGAAGTGKTSLLHHLRDLLEDHPTIVYAAYTGKAADVLTKKGLSASTIHSLIYFNKVTLNKKGKEEFHSRLKPRAELEHIHLIVIDEASMINQDIYNHLMSFGIPLLFVGDHQQLPPIDGELNLMEMPTFTLKKIHRQAEGDPIIYLAHAAYQGKDVELGRYGRSGIIPCSQITTEMMCSADQVICGKNVTRKNLNHTMRNKLGFGDTEFPQAGEKLICTRNSQDGEFRNGKCYEVVEFVDDNEAFFMFQLIVKEWGTEDEVPVNIRYDNFREGDFWKLTKASLYRSAQVFDFGYAITCHKAQGSEWNKVLLIEEPFGTWENQRRWSYTARTRAKEQLLIGI